MNLPEPKRRGKQEEEKQPIHLWLWIYKSQASFSPALIRSCSQCPTKQENICPEKPIGSLSDSRCYNWQMQGEPFLEKGRNLFFPEPLLPRLVLLTFFFFFFFFHLQYGQMSILREKKNMELSFPREKLSIPEALPYSVPRPGTRWTLGLKEAPRGWGVTLVRTDFC